MSLPQLPPKYVWDQYMVTGRDGEVLVTQLRKKVLGPFSVRVGDRKVEVHYNGTPKVFPQTSLWADDVARNLWEKES